MRVSDIPTMRSKFKFEANQTQTKASRISKMAAKIKDGHQNSSWSLKMFHEKYWPNWISVGLDIVTSAISLNLYAYKIFMCFFLQCQV